MSDPAGNAAARALIVERLVGATGEPDKVADAARSLVERALPGFAAALGNAFPAPLAVDVADVELGRMVEARPSASNHSMAVVPSATSPDALVLSIDADALALAVSLLFGGDPDEPPAPIARELSPLETDVATMLFDRFAQALNGSGSRGLTLKLPVSQAFTGTEMTRHILRDGPAVRVSVSLATAAARGLLVLTMPQRVLLKAGEADAPGSGAAPAAEWRSRFSEEVMRSAVRLEATMPLARLTLGAIAGFAPGQVIELEETAQTQATLKARGKTLFVCEFGKLGQNYTVRVRHPHDAGQDFIDGLMPG